MSKRAAKNRSRHRRIADQEIRNERHAQLVAERSRDDRYAHQQVHSDGSRTISWDPDSEDGALLSAALLAQREAFREKFGHEPGPNDPVFFDPDANTPTMLTEEDLTAPIIEMIEHADEIGVPAAYLQAFLEVGFLVTEMNQHLFSVADLELWEAAVEKHGGVS